MKHIICFSWSLLLLSSCANVHMTARLDEIGRYVYEDPGRVSQELSVIDKSVLGRSNYAKYCLINALALNRQHSDTTDFDIILPAAQYYDKHGPDSCRMISQYCLGWIYYNRKDWPSAFSHSKESEDYLEASTSPCFKAMLYSLLSCINAKVFRTEEWLDYSRRWVSEAKNTKRIDWIVSGELQLASALRNNRKFKDADSVFYRAVRLMDEGSVDEKNCLFAAQIAITKRQNDPHLACRLYERALSVGTHMNDNEWHAYAYALLLCGNKAETFRILDSLESNPSTKETNYWRYRSLNHQKDYRAALSYLENYCSLWGKELTDNLNQSVYQALAEKNESTAEYQAERAYRLRLLICLVLSAAIALISFLSFLLYWRRVRSQMEIERLESIAEDALQMADLAQEEINSLSEKLARLRSSFCSSFQNQMAELGRLCERGISQDDRKARKDRAIEYSSRQVEKLLSEISEGEGKQRELEAEIDRSLDDVVAKLRSDFPELSDKDVLFLCYIILHFHTSTIAFLTGYTKDNVRQKRHRLSQLISSRKTPNSYLYELLLK